jgi:hypothetical protein
LAQLFQSYYSSCALYNCQPWSLFSIRFHHYVYQAHFTMRTC